VSNSAALTGQPIGHYLDALAAGTAAPGGGSAAALAGAMAAALLEMACNLTANRPRFAAHHPEIEAARTGAARLRQELTGLAQLDSEAYGAVLAAYRLPKTTPQQKEARRAALVAAQENATQTQLRVATACATLLNVARDVVNIINPNTQGDVFAALRLAEAGLQTAANNVSINLKLRPLKSSARAKTMRAQLNDLLPGQISE